MKNKVTCSICYREKNIDATLIPSICKIKHGNNCHRICQNCWWHPETGFGSEKSNHKCPGCEKYMALTITKPQENICIDLTKED